MPQKHQSRRVRLSGKCWTLRLSRWLKTSRGYCENPTKKQRRIAVDSSLRGQEKLEVIVHEFLHAVAWWLDESFVKKWAEDISRELWALGVRWKDEES